MREKCKDAEIADLRAALATPPAQATAARSQGLESELMMNDSAYRAKFTAAPTDLSAAIMALQRYNPFAEGAMVFHSCGDYVLFEDVLSLLASQPSAVPQAASASKLPEFLTRKVEQAIHDAKNPKGMRTNGPCIAHIEVTHLERLYRAVSAAVPQAVAVAVPEGWALVPKEPTREMCLAAGSAAREYMEMTGGNSPVVVYRAMLAAIPTTPSGETKG